MLMLMLVIVNVWTRLLAILPSASFSCIFNVSVLQGLDGSYKLPENTFTVDIHCKMLE